MANTQSDLERPGRGRGDGMFRLWLRHENLMESSSPPEKPPICERKVDGTDNIGYREILDKDDVDEGDGDEDKTHSHMRIPGMGAMGRINNEITYNNSLVTP